MSRKSAPCRDCEQREIGCHGRCEQYKAYRDSIDAAKAAREKEIMTEQYQIVSCLRNKKRARRDK